MLVAGQWASMAWAQGLSLMGLLLISDIQGHQDSNSRTIATHPFKSLVPSVTPRLVCNRVSIHAVGPRLCKSTMCAKRIFLRFNVKIQQGQLPPQLLERRSLLRTISASRLKDQYHQLHRHPVLSLDLQFLHRIPRAHALGRQHLRVAIRHHLPRIRFLLRLSRLLQHPRGQLLPGSVAFHETLPLEI